eukprot:1411780-Rhodomonas_salina.1
METLPAQVPNPIIPPLLAMLRGAGSSVTAGLHCVRFGCPCTRSTPPTMNHLHHVRFSPLACRCYQIHKLRHLRALDLSANSLTGLPAELGSITPSVLRVCYALPAMLSDLARLNLSHNSIVEVQVEAACRTALCIRHIPCPALTRTCSIAPASGTELTCCTTCSV